MPKRSVTPKNHQYPFRIGISGWTYEPWRGSFYPEKLSQKRELEFASRQLNSIEINGSFYSLQRPNSYQKWYEQTPADFVFAVKGGRFITHFKKLKEIEAPMANFFASGILRLQEKLGPILWQTPPNLKFDAETIEGFFSLLPRNTEEAAELAGGHDSWLEGRTWMEVDARRPIRHAMEIRHSSFVTPEFIRLLKKYNVAFVVADTAGKWPLVEELTTDFMYVRLHGDEEIYVSGYTDDALGRWAKKIGRWRESPRPKIKNVYVYFDNDVKVYAPFDAMKLSRMLCDFQPAQELCWRPPRKIERPRPIAESGRGWRGYGKKAA